MSKTILGAIVIIIVGIFQLAGIEIAPEKIQTTIEVILALIAAITIWIERVKKGDVSYIGVRK